MLFEQKKESIFHFEFTDFRFVLFVTLNIWDEFAAGFLFFLEKF